MALIYYQFTRLSALGKTLTVTAQACFCQFRILADTAAKRAHGTRVKVYTAHIRIIKHRLNTGDLIDIITHLLDLFYMLHILTPTGL
jgi:hypothetical protein